MQKHNLKAETRELTGRKVRRLRNDGLIPGTLYGKKIKSENVQVKNEDLIKVYKEAGETGLVEIDLNGKKHSVLISNIQVHPSTGLALHADFREVDLTEKVTASVPVELVGESPAEKQGLGTVVLLVNELEVNALPADLPEKFEINAEELVEVEQTVTVAQLKYDKSKVEVSAEDEQIIAKVEPPQKEEVVEEVAPVAGEAEVEVPTVAAEGETTEEKKEEN